MKGKVCTNTKQLLQRYSLQPTSSLGRFFFTFVQSSKHHLWDLVNEELEPEYNIQMDRMPEQTSVVAEEL